MVDDTRRESPAGDATEAAGDQPAASASAQAPRGPARRGGTPNAADVERAVQTPPETR